MRDVILWVFDWKAFWGVAGVEKKWFI